MLRHRIRLENRAKLLGLVWSATLLCGALAGCATPGSDARDGGVATDPPIAYEKVAASLASQPGWIVAPPAPRDGVRFLVGLSEHYTSEVEARDDAMRHARVQFAQYTGVDVSSIDEVFRSLYGDSSQVLASDTFTSTSRQETRVEVSRIEARRWYWEKYRAAQGRKKLGATYKYWVEVAVPLEEYQRVLAWKRQRLKDERAQDEQAAARARIDLQGVLAMHAERLRAIGITRDGDAVGPTLRALQAEWSRLDEALRRLQSEGDLDAADLSLLNGAKATVEHRLNGLRSAIRLDSGRFGRANLAIGASGGTVSVWGCVAIDEACRPLAHFPIRLSDLTGETLSRAVTDRRGRADLHVQTIAAGSYRVTVDTQVGALSSLGEPTHSLLEGLEIPLQVSLAGSSLSSAAASTVAGLFNGPSYSPLEVQRVVLGPVVYGDSGRGSGFSLILKHHIAEHLTAIRGLELLTPRRRSVETVTRALTTRSLTAQTKSLGNAATQAVIDRADAAVETTFRVLGDELRIDMTLKEAGTDKLLSASSAVVSASLLPVGVQLKPPPLESFPAQVERAATPIRLDVTSHLGDGQTYREGERISFFVRTDRDAHLLLIYEDAAQQLIQVLPNRYSRDSYRRAGSVIEIPAVTAAFEFIVSGPTYGLERIWAFAASAPFGRLAGVELDNGLIALEGDLAAVLHQLRGEGQRGAAYGEAQAIVTTVPR